jgi:hypothetical protein
VVDCEKHSIHAGNSNDGALQVTLIHLPGKINVLLVFMSDFLFTQWIGGGVSGA